MCGDRLPGLSVGRTFDRNHPWPIVVCVAAQRCAGLATGTLAGNHGCVQEEIEEIDKMCGSHECMGIRHTLGSFAGFARRQNI
jgi:hypothetical protein